MKITAKEKQLILKRRKVNAVKNSNPVQDTILKINVDSSNAITHLDTFKNVVDNLDILIDSLFNTKLNKSKVNELKMHIDKSKKDLQDIRTQLQTIFKKSIG